MVASKRFIKKSKIPKKQFKLVSIFKKELANPRNQAALEFIMTYGWAILVVLVAIGALAYFGVLSPDKFLPAACILQPGLACLDHKATATSLQVDIQNSLGRDITIDRVTATQCTELGSQGTISNGGQATFIFPTCTNPGTKYHGQFNITYTALDFSIARTNLGEITTRIEGQTIAANVTDTIAPTVSITAPISGSNVSGVVTVSATASDNVGVVGVQFRVDGFNVGLEDTTAPYSISWNTATASNGVHSLTATARDVAGNTATSIAVTVTVSNAAPSLNMHYVRAGATGSGTGSDWTNAFTDLPASLIRGDTYYIAAGIYGGHTFNDALSGTQVIEIRAVTVADHGTDAGWLASYVGEALFRCAASCGRVFNFVDSGGPNPTGFYKINGVYRNANWQGGYGIRVSCANKLCTDAVIGAGDQSGPHNIHDITLSYIDVDGSHATSDADPSDHGIYWGQTYNVTVDHSYIHDIGVNPLHLRGGTPPPDNHLADNHLYEYNYIAQYGGTWTGSVRHTEIAMSDGVSNMTFRYNYVYNGGSTAIAHATPSGSSWNAGNWKNGPWYIYGNVIAYKQDATRCGAGNGVFALFDVAFDGNVYVFSNTISNIKDGTPGCVSGGSTGASLFGFLDSTVHFPAGGGVIYIENNLVWNSRAANGGGVSPTGGSIVMDYNAYYDTSSGNDPGTQTQSSTGNPFTNWLADTPGSDFTLLANTTAGVNTNSLVPGNAVDMNGRTRGADGTWDRGAFEFP